ncbi:3'-5' exonuclease domain-containing protein [Heterostelium album PN500]|uniref:3'-5' exonuclease domain-containing protein n=1 Tax=Heterostelium pallidum (strain ATCC 26659 / Pp 5 / PN500) TaxID=670386 RepID=D3B4F9_HETP5|nr:3'-5' exonuclease domain-containing protein [Heterostelium album PN500]EFA84207.1 3'-5' exonuclease domain-containing protein [Heterostelium album PN500]|eukprot:XP_020436323.1 3'-5' exonuclease domain-containing protein [Heterostelium album PN500]
MIRLSSTSLFVQFNSNKSKSILCKNYSSFLSNNRYFSNSKNKKDIKADQIEDNDDNNSDNNNNKKVKSSKNEILIKKLTSLPGSNLKKALGEIKLGKLGSNETVAKFKEDITDTSNPSNKHVRQLDEERCSFDGVFWIDSELQLDRCFNIINHEHVIAIDVEGLEMGKQGEISLVQVGLMSGRVFLFDVLRLGQQLFDRGLRQILESNNILKIVHDCRRDSEILYHRHQRAVDLKYEARQQFTENPAEIWGKRPLSKLMIDYSALDAIVLHPIYNVISPQLQSPFDRRFLKKNFKEQLSYFKDTNKQDLYARNLI